ncbi:MAG: helix-turn-helix transcriptional regulator [Lachnospiraceae bacterium]|nr:helix-turn-helix transcriptional regulator [Lachnospiraceae bacterium]
MFINKAQDGSNNISGKNIAKYRKELGISQRELADRLQLLGLDLDKNAIQRIESGKRFVTDIELSVFSLFFQRSVSDLMK